MCETKAVVATISKFLLVAAIFCIYQTHTENKVEPHSKIKSQGPFKNEYKKYKKFCLNGGDCYYPVDEGIVVCNGTWFCGGK